MYDWLRGTLFQVFSGGKAISSKGSKSQKRERDGALVMRWKKANEAHRTKFSLMIDEKITFFQNFIV